MESHFSLVDEALLLSLARAAGVEQKDIGRRLEEIIRFGRESGEYPAGLLVAERVHARLRTEPVSIGSVVLSRAGGERV